MSSNPINASANTTRKRPTHGARFFAFLPSPLLSLLVILGAGQSAVLPAAAEAALQLTANTQVDGRGLRTPEAVAEILRQQKESRANA
jgi:hypothetical protein